MYVLNVKMLCSGPGGPLIAHLIQEFPSAVLLTIFCFHVSYLKTQKFKLYETIISPVVL